MEVGTSLVFQTSISVSILGFLLLLLFLYFTPSKSKQNEPPGPRPIPIFGNLLQLSGKLLHVSLLELSRKYGSVFTVWMGPKKVVVLTGYTTVKEALVGHAKVFGDRAVSAVDDQAYKGHGLAFSNGDMWKKSRSFALTKLKDFGMGKSGGAFEEKILAECGYLVEVLRGFRGQPFDSMQPLNNAMANIICCMVYGRRFEYSDHEFITMVEHVNRRVQLGGSPSVQLYNMFPWTGRWIKDLKKLMDVLKFLRDTHAALIQSLRETLDLQICRGFIDAFLTKQSEESGETGGVFTDENLVASVMSLFAAGTETTSTALRWGLLLMAKYPRVQEQVREEIEREVGQRQVQTEDRKMLHFTNAVIHETLRFGNISPLAIPHRTSQDVTFQDYFIEKGTAVFVNLYSVLYDETQWEQPHSFHPAHFLDPDGRFKKQEALMAFSKGSRVCLGESLAQMELFLFFATLMQRFRFTPPPGVTEEELDLTGVLSMTLSPRPHQICAESRS